MRDAPSDGGARTNSGERIEPTNSSRETPRWTRSTSRSCRSSPGAETTLMAQDEGDELAQRLCVPERAGPEGRRR